MRVGAWRLHAMRISTLRCMPMSNIPRIVDLLSGASSLQCANFRWRSLYLRNFMQSLDSAARIRTWRYLIIIQSEVTVSNGNFDDQVYLTVI